MFRFRGLETPVYSCYKSSMAIVGGNGIPDSGNVPSARILGWSSTSRALLAAICLIGSFSLWRTSGEFDRPTPPQIALVVDPNTAPPAVLMALPRLGPALVGRIVTQRDIEPFDSIEDLDRRVKGIGPATIKSIRPFLKVETRSLNSPQ